MKNNELLTDAKVGIGIASRMIVKRPPFGGHQRLGVAMEVAITVLLILAVLAERVVDRQR